MQILRINVDHKLLLELVLHLQRVPEADKYKNIIQIV